MNTVSSLKRFAVVLATLAVFALVTISAFGQAIDGSLTGTVVDPSGAAVTGADVTALNVATGQRVNTVTHGLGGYRFNDLPVGTYNITVSAANFKTTTLTNIPVVLNATGTANVTLEVGTAATTVEVSGVAPPVDTTSAQLQTTYDSRYAQDLGMTATGGQGAGVLNLSMLSPGVTNANAMGDGMGPSVGGMRPRDNNFTVEGVDNNNKSVTGALISVPNDAVENFTLLENQFSAEFGHSSGGQFNTTIRSGTNGFHGSLYEYFRNRNLNAVDETFVQQGLTKNPRLDSNRYGATFGGPIIKNKLFFFTDFERQPVGLTGAAPGTVDTPTAAGLAAIAADPNLNATNLGIFKQYVPVAAAGSGCIPFNGTSNAVPFGKGFSAPANGQCGAGNVEVGPISIVPPAYINYTNFVQSVDFNMSTSDQLRGRYVYNDLAGPDTAAQLPAFYVNTPTKFRLFTIGEYHTFTPSILNEFRIGFNRFYQVTPVGNQKFPGLDEFPNVVLGDLGGGLTIGPDPNAPQYTIQNYYSGVDNLSWTKGKHTLKFGVEYADYISPQHFTQRERGDYEYNATQLYLEDFSPDFLGQRSTGASTYYGNQHAIYWYADDTWRVTPNLTLSLGVRYEYTSIPLGEQRQGLNTLSNSPNVIIPQVNEPLIFATPRAPKNDYAPRIGLAYSPGTSGTTSIRAGFGMAYDTLYDNIGILAVPPQIGGTNNVNENNAPFADFLGAGGLVGGAGGTPNCTAAMISSGFSNCYTRDGTGDGSGIGVGNTLSSLAATSGWVEPNVKYPYSINWNLGVQHSFGKNYTAEVNYVGTRANHLDVQSILNFQSVISPQTALPTYLSMPSQATLNALTSSNLNALENLNIIPANLNNVDGPGIGFNGSVMTGFLPTGSSNYNGLESQLQRRFSNGLTFQAAYTYSHTIDDSTADFHSTDLTPRRSQDFFNSSAERATSALSRTHRFTIAAVYDLPYFRSGNWLEKNVLGNWQLSPVYTYESPELVTIQSARDSNLNGDTAGDRGIFNPTGIPGTGTDVTALTATAGPNAGQIVAYVAQPLPGGGVAQYIRTGLGSESNLGRNTLATVPTNNVDAALSKDINLTERFKFRIGAQFSNVLNHPQYIPGSNPGVGLGVNDVTDFNSCCTTTNYRNFATPGKANFNNPKETFGSNARTLGIVAKFIF